MESPRFRMQSAPLMSATDFGDASVEEKKGGLAM
jgi:hypothetical protein